MLSIGYNVPGVARSVGIGVWGCLLSALLISMVPNRAYAAPAFEVATDTALNRAPQKSVTAAEPFQCLATCLEEESFDCKAVDFNPVTNACRLSGTAGAGVPSPGTDQYTVTDDGKGRSDTKCFSGGEKDGALCYRKCKAG